MHSTMSRSDAIYGSLRRAILEQALKPGVKLPEDQIGDSFGASRTLVRAALVRLGSEGLVDIRPNRGAAVAMPTWEDAREVFAMRRCLEGEVIDQLCANLPKGAIDALIAHVRLEERAVSQGGPRSIRLAGEFHILLAQQTGSRILCDFVSQVVSRASLILARFGRPHSAECGIDEHVRLIEALRRQDREGARRIMDHHLVAVENRANASDDTPPDISAILTRYAAVTD